MPFLTAARECALALMETAERLGTALPQFTLDAPTERQLTVLLPELDAVGRKVFQTVTLLQTAQGVRLDTIDQSAVMRGSVDQIAALLRRLNRIVITLRSSCEHDPQCRGAYILIAEAAVKILGPFNRARDAALHRPGTSFS